MTTITEQDLLRNALADWLNALLGGPEHGRR